MERFRPDRYTGTRWYLELQDVRLALDMRGTILPAERPHCVHLTQMQHAALGLRANIVHQFCMRRSFWLIWCRCRLTSGSLAASPLTVRISAESYPIVAIMEGPDAYANVLASGPSPVHVRRTTKVQVQLCRLPPAVFAYVYVPGDTVPPTSVLANPSRAPPDVQAHYAGTALCNVLIGFEHTSLSSLA